MCTREETRVEIQTQIKPIKGELDEVKKDIGDIKKRVFWGLLGSLTIIISASIWIGMFVSDVRGELERLNELIALRTEDRFYKQDGEVLQQQITNNREDVQDIKSSLLRIETKIDKAL